MEQGPSTNQPNTHPHLFTLPGVTTPYCLVPRSDGGARSQQDRGDNARLSRQAAAAWFALMGRAIRLCAEIGFGEPQQIGYMRAGERYGLVRITYWVPRLQQEAPGPVPSRSRPSAPASAPAVSSPLWPCPEFRHYHRPVVYVLRMPRAAHDDAAPVNVRDQVAILRFLAFHGIPVPRVAAWDATANNALNQPYLIVEHLPGEPADTVLGRLTTRDRCDIARDMARLCTRLHAIDLPGHGRLVRPTDPPLMPCDVLPLSQFFGPLNCIGVRTYRLSATRDMPLNERGYHSIVHLLYDMCRVRSDRDAEDSGVPPLEFPELCFHWGRLAQVIEEMELRGVMTRDPPAPEQPRLWHRRLTPDNVLLDQDPVSGAWRVTGLLGWDEVLAAPGIMTRTLPSWIWLAEPAATISTLCQLEGTLPPGVDLQLVRQPGLGAARTLFLYRVGLHIPSYLREVRGRGRWLQRVMNVLLGGLARAADWDAFVDLVQDWREFLCGRQGSALARLPPDHFALSPLIPSMGSSSSSSSSSEASDSSDSARGEGDEEVIRLGYGLPHDSYFNW